MIATPIFNRSNLEGNTIREQCLRADKRVTHVLGEPTETFTVTLPLNDGNHEEFDGADVIEGDLALR